MILIFRGWGILAFLIGVGGLGALASFNVKALWAYGLVLVCCGLVNWFLGSWMNLTRAARTADARFDTHRRQVWQQVETGLWRRADGSVPQSLEEARHGAQQQLEVEHEAFRRAFRNRNTFFFIPWQYIGALGVIAGVVVMIVSLFR